MAEKENNNKEYSQEIINALRQITDNFRKEDTLVRERQIRTWKKMDYYWQGFTRIWWSSTAHDWRIYDANQVNSNDNNESAFYDKPVNVFRAYLESIIAAMSATVPPIKCVPDDADNTLDLSTAKGGNQIATLVYKHIDAPLLFCKALFVYCTQGMIAGYNYSKSSTDYGTYEENKYEDVEVEGQAATCPVCGNEITDVDKQVDALETDEYSPDEDDIAAKNILNSDKYLCANCLMLVDPEFRQFKTIVTRLVGKINKPKARQCLEVNGGLFVKVPVYARSQCECLYLIYSDEVHYAQILEEYPDLRDEIGRIKVSGPGPETYERWGRLSPQYYGEYPQDLPTRERVWLRPCSFEIISDDDIRKKLKKEFPDGAYVTFVNDIFACACNESLDDHWTLTYNPLSEYIHFDPLGMLLTSVQEITNDLLSLVLQTIEHGIPQTFADPQVLNFKQYGQTEAAPGQIFPAKARSGKSLQDGFYEIKTATLSREVEPFSNQIQELGQFVSGALPSLYGGAQPGSSRTASQYAMSRAQSLQRLQVAYKMINTWWKNCFGKIVPAYIKDMMDDERLVKEEGPNNYVNILIKKAELIGKIGSIELESSDEIPLTLSQVKDVVMQLMQTNNPEILQALATPENLPILAKAIGLDNFNIPGEDDRAKQFEEIQQLIGNQPLPSGMGDQEMPSVMPEPLVDNHEIEAEICRSWLVSEAGRQCKVTNPEGYKNVLLHLQAHQMIMQQMMQMQQMAQMQSQMSAAQQQQAPNKPAPAPAQQAGQ